jgi:hypothetical protein
LHEDIKKFFPSFIQDKIVVANFGPLKPEDVATNVGPDSRNIGLVKNFIKGRNGYPILISISTAKHNKAYQITEELPGTKILMLYIDPNGTFEGDILKSENLLYIPEKVGVKFLEYLKTLQYPIGIIGHNNLSVATSLYMFATMGFPIITLDFPPNSTLVRDNKIGAVLKNETKVNTVAETINHNYTDVQKNIDIFLKNNSWEKSIQVHRRIFN